MARDGRDRRATSRALASGHADAIGAVLALGFAIWIAIAAAATHTPAMPILAVVASTAAAYLAGRALTTVWPPVVPMVVVTLVALAFAIHAGEVASGAPLEPPLGYANANAALAVQGAVAAAFVATLARVKGLRVVAGVVALALVALAIASGSRTVAVLLVLAVVPAAVAVARRSVAALAAGAFVVLLVAIGATLALGHLHASGSATAVVRSAERVVSARRVDLWRDAWILLRRHPVTGVGQQRFATESPTARADPDARWAHEEFLQVGAESGVIAAVVLVALFGWAFWRLAPTETSSVVRALGVVSVAAVGLHATIDYVLHFPAVPAAAAALLGAAVSLWRSAGPAPSV
jgi:O-antigen ligase